MLKVTTLSEVLHAVVTRFPERAVEIVAGTDELTDDERAVLAAVLDRGGEPTDLATAFGDAVRSLGATRWHVSECYRAAFYASDGPRQLATNPLYAQFLANKGGMTYDKWVHYFAIYDRHLSRWRGTDVRVLEIGTFRGGGLDALRTYLGPDARLVGADIDQVAADVARRRHVVELGDQTDPDFLRSVHEKHGPFDVVIDDGGHTMEQQLVSAQVLLPLVADGGVYIVEDTHTSYWAEFGGGLRREGTFLEWAKSLIDEMNAHHWSTDMDLGPIARRLQGLHAYDSVVVLDVGTVHPPFSEIVGMWDFLRLPRQGDLVLTGVIATRESAQVHRAEAEAERDTAIAKLAAVHASTSWRVTAPLRALRRKG
jgi:Methyltransferase domain